MTLEEQKAVFQEMLRELERLGKCKDKYHQLALELLDDELR